MKNLFALLVTVVLAMFCSCQKHLTDEELQARIEREVKRQLAAEREAQEKELEQRRAQFNARKNVLLEKRGATTNTGAPAVPRPAIRPSIREGSANPATAGSPGAIRRPHLPPGVTLPERPSGATLPGRQIPAPMPADSEPATSKTLETPPVAPAGSQLPDAAAESASPTPTPGGDGTAQ